MKKPLMIFIAAGFLIAVIFLFLNPRGPCEGIFEQTAPSLSVKVAALKANGEWAIGPEKVQDVSEGAQKIAVHLKSCCISQQSGYMKPEQYQVCVNGAKDYDAKIVQITNIIGEAQAAKQQGNTQLAEQKAAEAKTTVDASTAIERDLGKLAEAADAAKKASQPPSANRCINKEPSVWDLVNITSGGRSFPGGLRISQGAAEGSFTWVWDYAYSGTGTISGSAVTLDGSSNGLQAHWDGTLDQDCTRMEGRWRQSDGQVGTFTAAKKASQPLNAKPYFFFDFKGITLGDKWEVIRPDPNNYALETDGLLILNSKAGTLTTTISSTCSG